MIKLNEKDFIILIDSDDESDFEDFESSKYEFEFVDAENEEDADVMIPESSDSEEADSDPDGIGYEESENGEEEVSEKGEDSELHTPSNNEIELGSGYDEDVDDLEDDQLDIEYDKEVETYEDGVDSGVDPDEVFSAFDKLQFKPPTMDLDVSSMIAEKIREEAILIKQEMQERGEPGRYTPHPKAGAELHQYDEDDWHAKDRFERESEDVTATTRSIAAQLRRVLSARSLNRTIRDQRRGKLDRRKLYSLNLPGRKPNKNVFTQNIAGKSQKVVVGLLVDESGSMMGSKMQCARRATIALGDALHSIQGLGVRFQVHGFKTSQYYKKEIANDLGLFEYDRIVPLIISHYKSADENWAKIKTRVGSMKSDGANADNESIRYAAAQLMEVENVDRRVLIVLSDGAPVVATGRADGHDRVFADTKLAVSQCVDLGIEVLGIGICSTAVKDFYPSWVVINNSNDLERVLMDGLKSAFGLDKARGAA